MSILVHINGVLNNFILIRSIRFYIYDQYDKNVV